MPKHLKTAFAALGEIIKRQDISVVFLIIKFPAKSPRCTNHAKKIKCQDTNVLQIVAEKCNAAILFPQAALELQAIKMV